MTRGVGGVGRAAALGFAGYPLRLEQIADELPAAHGVSAG
jgi:hypothetical protein